MASILPGQAEQSAPKSSADVAADSATPLEYASMRMLPAPGSAD
jgi:hypothetical protein